MNNQFHSSLVEAIQLYSEARQEALALLYKKKDLRATRPMEVEADFEEVAASCGYFSFSLQDFAEEMKVYLDILDELKQEVEDSPRRRSWTWLKFWRRQKQSKDSTQKTDPGTSPFMLVGQVANAVQNKTPSLIKIEHLISLLRSPARSDIAEILLSTWRSHINRPPTNIVCGRRYEFSDGMTLSLPLKSASELPCLLSHPFSNQLDRYTHIGEASGVSCHTC